MESIQLLHNKIMEVAPIYGVCPDEDRIDFKESATQQEIDDATAIMQNWNNDLEILRNQKLKELENLYNIQLSSISVKLAPEDEIAYLFLGTPDGQSVVSSGVVLLREAESQLSPEMAALFPGMNLSDAIGRKLWTTNGELVDVTVQQYRILSINFGKEIAQIQTNRFLLLNQINQATTETELNNINVN